jgi:hypothetical protein
MSGPSSPATKPGLNPGVLDSNSVPSKKFMSTRTSECDLIWK